MYNEITCERCKKHYLKIDELICKNGAMQLRKSCPVCGFMGFLPQNKPIKDEDILYFGKHKGKTYLEVYTNHLNYLRWCIQTFENKSMSEKIEKYIADKFIKEQKEIVIKNFQKEFPGTEVISNDKKI